MAAPRAASAPELDVDSQSAAAAQPQSLELPPLSQADVTAQQPISKFSILRQQRKEARQRWANSVLHAVTMATIHTSGHVVQPLPAALHVTCMHPDLVSV